MPNKGMQWVLVPRNAGSGHFCAREWGFRGSWCPEMGVQGGFRAQECGLRGFQAPDKGMQRLWELGKRAQGGPTAPK